MWVKVGGGEGEEVCVCVGVLLGEEDGGEVVMGRRGREGGKKQWWGERGRREEVEESKEKFKVMASEEKGEEEVEGWGDLKERREGRELW